MLHKSLFFPQATKYHTGKYDVVDRTPRLPEHMWQDLLPGVLQDLKVTWHKKELVLVY